MNINIDRITGKVVPSQSPLTFSITLDDDFSLSKVVEKVDRSNQKTNEEGELIYLDSEGNETSEVTDNPVMIDNTSNVYINFADSPYEFTCEEILQEKYQSLLEFSSYDYIVADIFLNEEDIDLADKDHAANTGVAIMQLLPNGQAKTKTITLEAAVSYFELLELESVGVDVYINDVKFINNKAILSAATNEVVIEFKNTANKAVDVKSYAIAY